MPDTEHSKKILDQLEEVRDDGRVNMLDWKGVQHAAYSLELWDLVTFIEDATFEEYTSALDAMGERVSNR